MAELNIKKIRPTFNNLLTTMDKYEKDVTDSTGKIIIANAGNIKEYQKVIAVGPSVRDIKEGDIVQINPRRYAVRKHEEGSLKNGVITDNPVIKYNFNVVYMDYQPYLYLQDCDVDYIIQEYEELPDAKIQAILDENNLSTDEKIAYKV